MRRNYKIKFSKIILISTIFVMLLSLAGCFNKTYRITFKDYDDTVIKTIKVNEGQIPEFGDAPTRESDSFYEYTFFSWDKPLLEAEKDETYTAVYITDLINDSVEEDINIVDDTTGEPEKQVEGTDNTPEKVEVLNNTSKTEDTYTVTFYDDDKKTILQKSNYKYGSTPRYKNGLGPSKIVGDYLYVFKSWDKPISIVKSDQFYYAIYDKSKLGANAEERLQVESNMNATQQNSNSKTSEYVIKLTPYKQEWGTVQGGGSFPKGSSIVISAKANEGYIFSRWSDGDSSASRKIIVNSNAEYTAVFEPLADKSSKKYYVSVLSSNPSMGNVSLTPYRADGLYNEGEKINITASPKPGYSFVKWIYGNEESNAIERKNLTVSSNITYIAFFEVTEIGPTDEELRQLEEEQKQLEEEQQRIEQEQQRLEEEQRLLEELMRKEDQQKLEEERRKLEEEQQKLEEEQKKLEEEQKLLEEQQRLLEEQKRLEEEQKRLEEEQKRLEELERLEEQEKLEEEQQKLEEEQKKLEEEKKLLEEQKKLAEEQKRLEELEQLEEQEKLEEEQKKLEEQQKQLEEERKQLEEERKQLEEERERQEQESSESQEQEQNPSEQDDPTNPNPSGQDEDDPSNPSSDPSNPGTVDPNAKYKIKGTCNSEHGRVIGGSDEAAGNSTVQLTAIPNEGYVFVKWEDGNTDNPREVTVTGDHEYVAVFALDTFPVKGQIVTFSKEPNNHKEYIVINKSGSKLLLLNRDSNTTIPKFGTKTDTYETSDLSDQCEAFYNELSESFRNAVDNASIDINQYSSYVAAFDELAHASNAAYPGVKINTLQRHAFALDISEIENYFGNTGLNASTFSSNDLNNLFNLTIGLNTWLRSQNTNSTEYMVTGNPLAKIVYYSKDISATTVLRPALVVDFNKLNKSDYAISNGFTVDGQPKKYTLTVNVNDANKGSATGGGQYPIGSNVLIEATPTEGNKFVVWEDGSTSSQRLVPITGDTTCTAKFSIQGLPSKGDIISFESTEKKGYSQYTVLNISGNIATLLNRDSTYKYSIVGDSVSYSSSSLKTACANFYNNLSDTMKFRIQDSTFSINSYNAPSDDSNFNRSKHASYVNSYESTIKQNSVKDSVYLPDIKDIEEFFGGTSTKNGVFSYKDLKSIFGITNNENIILRSYVSGSENDMFAIYGVSGDDIKAINSIEESFLSSFYIRPIIKVDLSDLVYSIDGKFVKAAIPSYTINVASSDNNLGTVSSGGTYEDGTKLELIATPKNNSIFAYWSDGNTENPRTITVDSNNTFKAFFRPISIQIGDIITLNTEKAGFKEYVVLNTSINNSNDMILTLLNRDCNLGKMVYQFQQHDRYYLNSNIDTTLNEGDFYNGLSTTLKNAIVPSPVPLYEYNIDGNDWELYKYNPPKYPYYSTIVPYDGILSRNIFLPDLSDIERFFGGSLTELGYYTANDLRNLFNCGDSSIWLRSHVRYIPGTGGSTGVGYTDNHSLAIVNGIVRSVESNYPDCFAEIRPMFNVNLTKLGNNYTRTGILYKSNVNIDSFVISVRSCNNAYGTTEGGGRFYNGTIHKLVANPKNGYKFLKWSDGNTDNPRLITVNDSDKEFVAIFDYDLQKGDFVTISGEDESHNDYMILDTEGSKVYLLAKDHVYLEYYQNKKLSEMTDDVINLQLSEYMSGLSTKLKNLMFNNLFNTYSYSNTGLKQTSATVSSPDSKIIDTVSLYEILEFLNKTSYYIENTSTIFNIPYNSNDYYHHAIITRDKFAGKYRLPIFSESYKTSFTASTNEPSEKFDIHVCPVFWIDLSQVNNYNLEYTVTANYFDDSDDTYTIRFLDGNKTLGSKVYKTGEMIVPPEVQQKNGYVVDGWEPNLPDFMPPNDMTVNAKWDPIFDKGDFITITSEDKKHDDYMVLKMSGTKLYLLSKDHIYIDYELAYEYSEISMSQELVSSQLTAFKNGLSDELISLMSSESFDVHNYTKNNDNYVVSGLASSDTNNIDCVSAYEIQQFIPVTTLDIKPIFNLPYISTNKNDIYTITTRDKIETDFGTKFITLEVGKYAYHLSNNPYYHSHACPVFWIDLSKDTGGLFTYEFKGNFFYRFPERNVTFKDGSTVLKTEDLEVGELIVPPSDPVKSGYTFSGWSATVPDFIGEEDLEFSANWIQS